MNRLRGIILVLMMGVAAALATASPAAAAAPDPPCEWTSFGNSSGCDGLAAYGTPHQPTCGGSEEVYRVAIRTPGTNGRTLAYVALDYFRPQACQTIAASIEVTDSAASCYVKVERTSGSPRDAYRVGGVFGQWRFTQVLYDAGVTSYAWGSCTYQGATYTNGTAAF
jgi:hypothetical protein